MSEGLSATGEGAGDAASARRDAMVCRMARAIPDGSLCVRGLGTPLATAAIALAVRAHGRRVWIISTDGGGVTVVAPPVSLSGPFDAPAGRLLPFAELILEVVPRYQPFEFMRPAQLDTSGASNNVVIQTADREISLPGCGGIADATSVNANLVYYLPRHDRRTLVHEVDFRSGGSRVTPVGRLPVAPRLVITELCVMTFMPEGPRVESIHPGVTVEELRERTSFAIEGLGDARPTAAPTASELLELAALDPDRLRDLEFEAGAVRAARLESAVTADHAQANAPDALGGVP